MDVLFQVLVKSSYFATFFLSQAAPAYAQVAAAYTQVAAAYAQAAAAYARCKVS